MQNCKRTSLCMCVSAYEPLNTHVCTLLNSSFFSGNIPNEEHENYENDPKHYSYKKKIYKTMVFRILWCTCFFLFALYIQCYAIILSDSYYETGETPLKDRVHELIPTTPHFINGTLINALIGFLSFLTFIRFGIFCPFLLSLAILIRIIILLSFVYLLRSIFIYVTTLPCPVDTCIPLENKSFLGNLHTSYLIIFAKVYECTDLIISGHTAFTTMLLNLWIAYEQCIYSKLFIICMSVIIFFLIIISRFHYTVDVLIGYTFASCLFYFYHGLLDVAARRYAINGSFKKQVKVDIKYIHMHT